MLKFNCNIDYIPVSVDFIENYMPEANGAYVKVYLLALSLAVYGYEMSASSIASQLNLLESDVINAFEYWNKKGALTFDKNSENINFTSNSSKVDNIDIKVPIVQAEAVNNNSNITQNKKSVDQISNAMTQNKELADLYLLSQEILGKTLTNNEIETLYYFYDELELSPEVITMLLEYCVSKDIRNMNYIEKVAMSWNKNKIFTIDAADKFITAEKEKNSYTYKIRKLFGIENRNLSKTEETFLKTWHDKFLMNENMIELAYEYCIMQTTKLSFPYINSILKRWHELNIHNVADAQKDHEDFKTKNNPQKDLSVYNDNNINYDELEEIMRDKM